LLMKKNFQVVVLFFVTLSSIQLQWGNYQPVQG
jgi:hypothetical protein